MEVIDQNSKASIKFCLHWSSAEATHFDYFAAENVNFWRDCFSSDHWRLFAGRAAGDRVILHSKESAPLFPRDAKKIHRIRPDRFNRKYLPGKEIIPLPGRFYPQGLLHGIAGVFEVSTTVCRCLEVETGHILMDLNHPLAGLPVEYSAVVEEVRNGGIERGGRCEDWLELISTSGPGMQSGFTGVTTDFTYGKPFGRQNEADDRQFYQKPRMLHHIDATAREKIAALYSLYIKPQMAVLDLMGSWDSHLAGETAPAELVVLGLNEKELAANAQASRTVLHDLNRNPVLPFSDDSFDAVICTVSVEYLIHPYAIFSELGRILKPGGPCIMVFSNRWFPPKAVHIWQELHEFEKMGLVLDYFMESGKFVDLHTLSYRGRKRPFSDPHFGRYPYTDPVFVVAGKAA